VIFVCAINGDEIVSFLKLFHFKKCFFSIFYG